MLDIVPGSVVTAVVVDTVVVVGAAVVVVDTVVVVVGATVVVGAAVVVVAGAVVVETVVVVLCVGGAVGAVALCDPELVLGFDVKASASCFAIIPLLAINVVALVHINAYASVSLIPSTEMFLEESVIVTPRKSRLAAFPSGVTMTRLRSNGGNSSGVMKCTLSPTPLNKAYLAIASEKGDELKTVKPRVPAVVLCP